MKKLTKTADTTYTLKHADGTGRLQRGWYAHNETPDCMAEEDRWIGPFRTVAGARAAVRKAEEIAAHNGTDVDDELCHLACRAGRTPAMKRAREAHDRVRAHMS